MDSEAAEEGGNCDVSLDNKVVEDVSMDVDGDNTARHKDENDMMNGNKDETNDVTDFKSSGNDIIDTGLTHFAALNDAKNDDNNVDLNEGDGMIVDNVVDNDAKEDSGLDDQGDTAGVIDSKASSESVTDQVEGEGTVDNSAENNDNESTDHDETAASFVTATESLSDDTSGQLDQTVEEEARRSQEENDDRLSGDVDNSVIDGEIQKTEESSELSRDDEDQTRDSVQELEEAVQDPAEEEDSLMKDIQRDVSADDFLDDLNTLDTQVTTEENDENDQIPEAEEAAIDNQRTVEDSLVEHSAEASDTQDSSFQDTNLNELNHDLTSSPKNVAEDSEGASNTQDSVTDSTRNDVTDDTEIGEMASMQVLYEDSKDNEDSNVSGIVSEEQDLKDVDQCLNSSETTNNDDPVTEELDAKHVDRSVEAVSTDVREAEMEAEVANIESDLNAGDTSEPIISEVISLKSNEKETEYESNNEQMEVDDAEKKQNEVIGTEKSGVSEQAAEKLCDSEIHFGKDKSPVIDLDHTEAKDTSEETGDEKNAESQEDNDHEMRAADENNLLGETGEERKDDEEEAMETDEKIDEQESPSEKAIADKEPTTEKSSEEINESVEGTQKTDADAGKSAEDTQKTDGDLEESSEDTQKIADENDQSTEEPVKSTDKEKASVDMTEKEVKQEKLEDLKEETDDSSAGPKIVGVTSAVGIEEVKPAAVKKKRDSEASEGKKALSRTASPVVIDDEEDKKASKEAVKEEKNQGRTTRSSSAVIKKEQEEKAKPVKKEADDKDDDVIAIKEEKKPVTQKPKSSKIQKCIVCLKVGKCKYNIVRNGDVKHLCDDVCFKKFRSNPTEYLRQAVQTSTSGPTKADTKSSPAPAPNQNQQKQTQNAPPPVYKTCSVCQLMNVRTSKPFLNWQGLDFCGEECLGKFQGSLSATCSYCASQINQVNRAKFCWRVGTEVKQFCSSPCYNEFIKRLKLCAFCNKDLANIRDSFMAPVGNQGTFKDFCSQLCLAKYEERNTKDIQIVGVEKGQKTSLPPKGNYQCQVCGKTGPVRHEIKLDGKQNRLCSDPCLSAFQYANKLTMNTCDNCGTNCYNENTSPQYIQFEGQQKRFCSYMCVNSFKNFNKKTVPCAWCGAKKSNFDMIERVDATNKYQLFCSLNCLSLYRVNLQATSNQAVVCDECRKFVPAQYHLTMSDASVRNFCSYTCVMQFQQQFTTPKQQQQQTTNTARQQQQTTPQNQAGLTTRSKAVYNTRGTNPVQKQTPTPPTKQTARQIAVAQKKQVNNSSSIPIISNVVSLAPQGNQQQINVKSSTPVVVQGQQDSIKTTTTTTGNQTVQQQIIIQPPPPKTVKNKSLLCKPYVQTKATSCKPHTQTKEVQTEGKAEADRYFIPVPIPIYVPTPLAMYSTPTPVMIPVPLPVPVPVFIPTTKKSSGSILKQIKEIQEKIPNDPLEAELLMMAEAVAGKDEESSSESEDELPAALPEVTKEPAVAASGQELGEDMLQMALRMASEMSDEPVMDLENSLEPVAVSSVPPTAATPSSPAIEEDDDTDEYIPPSSRSTRRTQPRKRTQSTRRGRSKRQKMETTPEIPQSEATSSPQPTAPPPDANFHLKYTYGVNAWKHWVVAKNAQIESTLKTGTNKKLKMFKTDLLQCTADELNYALCLFVKEVRKPNGEEYAVDSIYYLCLGIQQYLFENGRIDNIFTDLYFEKFTDFLNEVLTMYEPKLNTAGQLVCRIEEEHLWESKQLGAHSPHVLLNSLVYFNTKYFMLKTSEDHLKLSFTHIMKHWKKTASGKGSGTGANVGRSVYLRYYCPNLQGKSDPNQKKRKEEMPVYEQTENLENPLRCPVKLYEFYLSKCPESIKNRNDTFYLVPERSCVPDSPVWYSTSTLGVDHMAKMLNRIRLVREIQEAHLHTQPVYI